MGEPTFKKVLRDYLNILEFEDAEKWIKKQPCSPSKKRDFLQKSMMTLHDIEIVVEAVSFDGQKKMVRQLDKSSDCYDFIDRLRERRECQGNATR